jgi:hypothetical protein
MHGQGVVKLCGVEPGESAAGCTVVLIGIVSANRGKADYVVPGGEAGCYFSTVAIDTQPVAAGPEVG